MYKNKNKKLISVVMPVYNAGDFLVDSIESILRQTHKNFEFVIVDDHSKDESWKIIQKYKKLDKRIKAYRNTKNLGVSHTVNRAIKMSRGEYIARMDADDISYDNRLKKQYQYLKKNKDTVAIGTQCILIDKNNKIIGKKTFPTKAKDIYEYIFTFVPVQQPSMMINRNKLPKKFEFYIDGMNTAEEIELFFKLFKYGKVKNLKDYLLMYRLHDNNSSLKDLKKTFLLTLISRLKSIVVYKYKPSFANLVTTICQTVIVLLLPKEITLWIYAKIRNISPDVFTNQNNENTQKVSLPNPAMRSSLRFVRS